MISNIEALQRSIADSVHVIQTLTDQIGIIDTLAVAMAECFRSQHKLLACGNGGSAADAHHLTAEWVGRFVGDRRGYPAIPLTADGPLLSALANDYPYERVFSRQVQALGQPGDMLVAFSSSGNSLNLIRAIEAAKDQGIVTVALLGRDGGKTAGLADIELIVRSNVTARIQEAHGLIIHLLCEEVERQLGHATVG